MIEGSPLNPFEDQGAEREQQRERISSLAIELSEKSESFPFPGIDPEAYEKLKAAEAEFPGYTTPIDELIKRFETEGIKVALGKDPKSGTVFIMPSHSDDSGADSIFPRQLQVTETMDEKLKELVLMQKDWERAHE